MFRNLIDKLKINKKQLQNFNIDDNFDNTLIEEESNFKIDISIENKIEISNYISIIDFVNKKNSSDEYRILDLLCNCVLWNGRRQQVNKGLYYVINTSNGLYNILFTDEKVKIDERTKIELDEQTQKENIIQERVITFNINNDEYYYFSAKHDKIGDTFYTNVIEKIKQLVFVLLI